MFTEPFAAKDGYRIWLDLDETDELLAAADSREERIAFALGVRSGLRVQEVVDVEAKDVVSTSAGPRVRVWDSKGKEYRETPTTKDILAVAETVAGSCRSTVSARLTADTSVALALLSHRRYIGRRTRSG